MTRSFVGVVALVFAALLFRALVQVNAWVNTLEVLR